MVAGITLLFVELGDALFGHVGILDLNRGEQRDEYLLLNCIYRFKCRWVYGNGRTGAKSGDYFDVLNYWWRGCIRRSKRCRFSALPRYVIYLAMPFTKR